MDVLVNNIEQHGLQIAQKINQNHVEWLHKWF